MKVVKHTINANYAYLVPLSDMHVGDKNFDEKKLQGYIDWVKKEPNARVWLNGDIINLATRTSASSPFDQTMDTKDQVDYTVKLFKPIKDKILGAISGNHEQRMEDHAGYNPLIPLCAALDIEWCNYSAVLDIKLLNGKNKNKHSQKGDSVNYTFYCHHTTGGGGTVGSKMNRVAKLKEIVGNMDCYIGSHNHQLGVMPIEARIYNERKGVIDAKRQLLVDTGSFLKWDEAYSERMQLQPVKLGAVRIRMDGTKKDLHCDL